MWTMWGVCPVMCGGGVQKRHRKCDSPAPTYGGRECTGADFDKRLCNNQTCPGIIIIIIIIIIIVNIIIIVVVAFFFIDLCLSLTV